MKDRLQQSADVELLLDFYGELLTDRQREILEMYCGEDLTLAEISERIGITRQGARDAIVRGEAILRDTESKLGLIARFADQKKAIEKLVAGLEKLAPDIPEADALVSLAKSLL